MYPFLYHKCAISTDLNFDISVTIGCGGSTSENCTYFEYTGTNSGPCNARVCKLSSAICQIRLDLDTFIITGPSTAVTTNSLMVELGGMIRAANGGKIFTQRTNCATDTFSIGNAPSVPTLCGTLTGDHGKYGIMANSQYLISYFSSLFFVESNLLQDFV